MNGDTFTLQNDPPKPPRGDFPGREKQRQCVLFTGLDCLPGQIDLFNCDGSPERSNDENAEHHATQASNGE